MTVFTYHFGFLLIVLVCFSQPSYQNDEATPSKTVTLPNENKLRGVTLSSFYSKKEYFEFRGIPYAKPPVDDLKFKTTSLYDEKWGSEPRDATEYGQMCPQLDPFYDPDTVEGGSYDEMRVLGDEDCLFVNVATSNVDPETPLPVLVWFHGGNFHSESGAEYGPGKLMDHDLVVVTFNSRLSILGYLNTEDENVAGNMGLKDQVILLQWVKQNIRAFGGNPDSITVAGFNAGAAAIHLHMLSDMSKGLFHRAVIQSGTAISPWILTKEPKERMQKLVKHLKCGNDTDDITCLTRTDPVKIIQMLPRMAEWYIDPLVPFGPSIEMFGKAEEKFLSKNPYNILAEGNYWAKSLPVIMGVNSHEGLLHAMEIGYSGMLRQVFNREWYGAAPISLYYKKSALDPRSVSEAVRHFYFPINEQDKIDGVFKLVDKDFLFDNMTNMYSDRHFFVPLHNSAMLMGQHNELYLYWLDYTSDQSMHGIYGFDKSHIFGPSHYDQLQYLFVMSLFNETTQDHVQFEQDFVSGLYNFVNTGNPFRDDWIQVSKEMIEETVPLQYNRVGKPSDAPNLSEPFADRVLFWKGQLILEYERLSFIDAITGGQSSGSATKDEL